MSANGSELFRVFKLAWMPMLVCVLYGCTSHSNVGALIAEFRKEEVFWVQAEIGDEIVQVATLREVSSLEPWLLHDDRRIRGNVAFIFAKLGDPRGLDTVFGILRDYSKKRAIHLEGVISVLHAEPDGKDAEERTASLKQSAAALASQITSDRYYAVHLLGELQDPRSIDVLIPLLDDSEINYHVAWALGEIGDARAIAPLIASLANHDALVRVSSIDALAKLHAVSALPQLEVLFTDNAIPNAGDQVTTVGIAARKAADIIRSRSTLW
jgi:HEAT repeat protein